MRSAAMTDASSLERASGVETRHPMRSCRHTSRPPGCSWMVATRLTTAVYGQQLKAGAVKEVPNGITFAGGVPIMRGGEFIGAVGTSGVRAIEDEQISKAGAGVIK